MAKTLSEKELLRLARLGAIARLEELEEEARAIRRMFPGLKAAGTRTEGANQAEGATAPKAGRKRPGRKTRTMSEEQRQAQRERMRAYWARRKGLAPEGEVAQGGVDASNEQAAPSGKRTRRPRRKARSRKAPEQG